MFYLFINENQIEKYNGEILKRYVGNKLVKVISNPTEQDLKDFGYKELVSSEMPEFDNESQYVVRNYIEMGDKIYEKYNVENILADEISIDNE